jgi:hypothetical protein
MSNFDLAQAHPIITVAIVGLLTGVGQLLASKEVLTARIVIGRALSSAALGVAAGVALAWIPDLPFEALVGLAAAISSLGTSGLERLFQRFIK